MTKPKKTQDIVVQDEEPQDLVVSNPSHLLELAVTQNLDIDKLERLMQMQERYEEKQARKAFYAAMARFQAEIPVIEKTKEVSFNQTQYKYAPIDSIVKQIAPALENNGLSHRFEITENGEIGVEFIVTHVDGHSERTKMTAAADTSGNKNAIQSRASTVSYLMRYTLIAGYGITTANEDNDGRNNMQEEQANVETLKDRMESHFPGNLDKVVKSKFGCGFDDLEPYQLKSIDGWLPAYEHYLAALKHAQVADISEIDIQAITEGVEPIKCSQIELSSIRDRLTYYAKILKARSYVANWQGVVDDHNLTNKKDNLLDYDRKQMTDLLDDLVETYNQQER